MSLRRRFRGAAASIVEITIAIVILGVVAALAIPQLSRADSPGPGPDVRARLTILRTAIELYHKDHGGYPCQDSVHAAGTTGPAGGGSVDESPARAAADSAAFLRAAGPYLRGGVPRSPLRLRPGPAKVYIAAGDVAEAIATIDADWIYNADTGYIFANSPRSDEQGVRFDRY